MTDVFAVTPRPNMGGRLLHIYVPGYRTAKARSLHETTLCGGMASTHWGTERTGFKPNGVRRIPILEALDMLEQKPTDPFSPWPVWRWCPKCTGILAEHLLGDLSALLRHVLEEAPK